MPQAPLSFVVPDASPFARSLGQALKRRHAEGLAPPGHVELLNLIARALGHRNRQSLQAQTDAALPAGPAAPVAAQQATPPLPTPPPAAEDRPPLPLTLVPAAAPDGCRRR